MPSLAEQVAYQAAMLDLSTAAIGDLVDAVGDFANLSADAAAALIRDTVPLLVAEYGAEAAAMSADFYEDARYAALGAAAAGFTAVMAPEPGDDVVQDALGWALAPLFVPEAPPDTATTLRRSAAKLQTYVAGQGRDTVERNAERDPVGTRYARYASPNACAFCRMLATRGSTYRTEQSATRVVGEVDEFGAQTRGVRGTQPLGEKYHDNCKCIAVPVFPGDRYDPAPHIAEWGDQYTVVSRATGTTRGDVSALLAKWRELYGAR